MAIEGKTDGGVKRRLRLGMVGGGQGAFIGGVHRIAARIDDHYELVAGALSSDADRARASAAELRIAGDRAYGSFAEMAEVEAGRKDGIDVVAVVTPNHVHHAAAKTFLEAGIHVICDKPMTADRPGLRPDPQLHRLSHGAARPGDDRGRRIGADPGGAGGVSAGLADHPAGE